MDQAATVMMTFARDQLRLATPAILHMEAPQVQELLWDPMEERAHRHILMDLTQWMGAFLGRRRWITVWTAILHLVMVDQPRPRTSLEQAIRQPQLRRRRPQQMVPRVA